MSRPLVQIALLLVGLSVFCLPVAADLSSVLVFSRTEGFRHGSIDEGIALIQTLGSENGFSVQTTEETTLFTQSGLAAFDVVVFLNTTGDVLDTLEEDALESFVQAGGGWIGVHAAADTEYAWPWYGQLLGGDAWFESHPAIQVATLQVENQTHPSTLHWPEEFSFQDEWYNFQANPRPSVNVLITIDETSYDPGPDAMGDHPVAWYHEFDGGRAWYTGLGHRALTYADPGFEQHLLGGLQWAAGALFLDGFESGNLEAWDGVQGTP